ncbi:MAG: hypothetical protein ACO1SV_10845 [Fimbriimonas sp.]
MLSALVFATVLTYDFRPDARRVFDVSVKFEGYLPVLGGTEGTVDVAMAVGVQGLAPDEKARPRAVSDIDTFTMKLNGSVMPFSKENVQAFFPRTTISLTPEGKVEATDAPDKTLPVRLPGLDVKRFPDITYLPIEFPKDGVEEGKEFTFRKSFGNSEALYTVVPTAVTAETVVMAIEFHQSYTSWEDARRNPVAQGAAEYEVGTDVKGEGTATFDRRRALVQDLKVVADAASRVTDVKTRSTKERKLRTTLTIKAKA